MPALWVFVRSFFSLFLFPFFFFLFLFFFTFFPLLPPLPPSFLKMGNLFGKSSSSSSSGQSRGKAENRVTQHDKAVLDLKLQRDKLTRFQKKVCPHTFHPIFHFSSLFIPFYPFFIPFFTFSSHFHPIFRRLRLLPARLKSPRSSLQKATSSGRCCA